MKVVVVGGGLAGLATAVLLACRKLEVTVLEKNRDLGGRARVWRSRGFSFDLGPSWYTMPETWERYFGLAGKRVSDYWRLERLDPIFSVYEEVEGRERLASYRIFAGLEKQMAVFEQLERGGGEKLQRHLERAKFRYDLAGEILYRHYGRFGGGDLGLAWRMRNAGIVTSWQGELEKEFSSGTAKKILGFASVFLGGSPRSMAGLFSLMNWAVLGQGVYYPMGGMGKLVEALAGLAGENGVKMVTGQEVVSVEYRKTSDEYRITALRTKAKKYEADVVVWAGDYHFAETQLLPEELRSYPEDYWRRKTMSPSGYCLYLGVRKRVKNLTHHNLYFSADWEGHFESVFRRKAWPERPSVYFGVTSKSDATVAPRGCENVFALVPVAAGIEDGRQFRLRMREYVLAVLERIAGEAIGDKIVVEREWAVNDFAGDYHAYGGSAFGLANTLLQTAWFRPKNKSGRVSNWYYVGQGAQPGIGVPMCAISAELTTKLIGQEWWGA